MMRHGVSMPAVERVIRRAKVERAAIARADFESGRVHIHTPDPEASVFPEPGAIDRLFREARKLRA